MTRQNYPSPHSNVDRRCVTRRFHAGLCTADQLGCSLGPLRTHLLHFSLRPGFEWIMLTDNLAAVDIERNAGDMLGRTACEIDGRAANIARSADAKRDTGCDGKNLGI